ncbi:MAG: PAS domain-containing protein [Lentisphaerota bacterium]
MSKGPGPEKTVQVSRMIENAKQELERMIDAHPQGMCLATLNGRIQRANQALLQILELTSYAEVIGKRFRDLLPEGNSPETLNEMDSLLAARPSQRGPYVSRQIKIKARKGDVRTLGFTVVTSSEDHDLIIVLVEDMTRREVEDLQRQKRLKMEAAEAVVGALMHTLNQHLTVITIRSQLLQLSLSRPNLYIDAMKKGLDEITNLSTQIAEILRQAQTFNDYVTMPYLNESAIVDLKKSTGEEEKM